MGLLTAQTGEEAITLRRLTSLATAWHLVIHAAEREEVVLTACPLIVTAFWREETSITTQILGITLLV